MRLALVSALVLVNACSLIEAPPPPGTRVVQVQVHNETREPIELSVRLGTAGGTGTVLAGAVQPPTVPAGPSTTEVTFYLPFDEQWAIDVPDWGQIEGKDFAKYIKQDCQLLMQLGDGGWEYGC